MNEAQSLDNGSGRNPLADRRFALASTYADEGLWREAADLYEQALELAPLWVAAWVARGDAFAALHEHEMAIAAFRRALTLDPGDGQGAALRLASLDPAEAPPTASPAYVRALFDAYAARFDTHLTNGLTYRGPSLLVAALADAGYARFTRALDLGCGTGLAGAILRPLTDRLEGIDLSTAMVMRARGKALYDRLEVGDILAFLQKEEAASADLLIAADVFVYIGDLGPILSEAARVTRPGGAVAFTAQLHQDDDGRGRTGYRVGADWRYAHTQAYLVATLESAGFAVVHWREQSTRRERNCDVPSAVVVGRRL